MTAISAPFRHATRSSLDAWRNAALVSAGLAAVTVARWAATRAGLDALAVGAVFGLALLLLAAPGPGARALATRVTRIDRGQLSRRPARSDSERRRARRRARHRRSGDLVALGASRAEIRIGRQRA